MKQNCWEYKKCGRESNGVKVKELGICPATTNTQLNGTHGGKFAGRTCWITKATLCKGEVQHNFGRKFEKCLKCDFYNLVKKEEGTNFSTSAVLLRKIKQ
jgi:hypothetical protein